MSNNKGIKFDEGKIRESLLVPEFIEGMAKVMEYGASKYEAWNWLGLEPERVFNSLLRHIRAMQKGEWIDVESGLPHLFHAGCNVMMLYTLHNNVRKENTEETINKDFFLYILDCLKTISKDKPSFLEEYINNIEKSLKTN